VTDRTLVNSSDRSTPDVDQLDLDPSDAEAAESDVPARGTRRVSGRNRSKSARWQHWTRLAHVYTSMVCFVIVLFFSVTGLTLNHPSWTLGGSGSEQIAAGVLPTEWQTTSGVDWLVVAEYLRAQHSLRGAVSDYESDDRSGSITFKGPAYSADAFIDVESGEYDITVVTKGPLGFFNDLHKGRDTRTSWAWLIDASAILLIVISASGLILQLFLRRRRRAAVVTAIVGAGITIALIVLAGR
jgi:uncharacterized protein